MCLAYGTTGLDSGYRSVEIAVPNSGCRHVPVCAVHHEGPETPFRALAASSHVASGCMQETRSAFVSYILGPDLVSPLQGTAAAGVPFWMSHGLIYKLLSNKKNGSCHDYYA